MSPNARAWTSTVMYLFIGIIVTNAINHQYNIVSGSTVIGIIVLIGSIVATAGLAWFVFSNINVQRMAPPKP